MFFFKSPKSKAEHIKSNKERDIKVKAHLLHMKMAENAKDDNSKSTGHTEESPDAGDGIDADLVSKIGAERQKIREQAHARSTQITKMRGRVRLKRRKSRKRGRSLGLSR